MGIIYADLKLYNAVEYFSAKKGITLAEDIHNASVSAMVDTGAENLVINESLLGAIPIEDMDVVIDSANRKLMVNPAHPNVRQLRMK